MLNRVARVGVVPFIGLGLAVLALTGAGLPTGITAAATPAAPGTAHGVGAAARARTSPAHDGSRGHVVSHVGRWLTNSRGEVVETHGLNLVIKVAPFTPAKAGINAADARFMKRHGFTSVRLGILMQQLEPRPGHFNRGYLRSIVGTANMLHRHGISSLVDFHQDLYANKFQGEGLPSWMIDDGGLPNEPAAGFPGNYFSNEALAKTFDNLWHNVKGPQGKPLQQWYAGAWRHVAKAFKGNPAVLGYDIFNEPWPGTGWQACFPPHGCASKDKRELAPFANRIIRAIHRVDPQHLAFFEPWQPFSEGAPTHVGTPGNGAVGFTFHVYCAAALGAPETPPTRAACNVAEHLAVKNGVKQGTSAEEALLLSEFGATSDTAELSAVESYADPHDVPWQEWAYCGCGDPTGSGNAEALVINPLKRPSGSNVNHTTLPFLDEPYPQRIAGKPLSYGFDQTTAAFNFAFTTRSVRTKEASTGTTAIYTSPLHYPHGYRVTIHGGRVVRRGTRQLVIRASPGIHQVSVAMTPRA